MNVLFLTKNGRLVRRINLRSAWFWLFSGVLLSGVAVGCWMFGVATAQWWGLRIPHQDIQAMQTQVSVEQTFVRETQADVQKQLQSLAARLGELQGRAIRLDALGERLTVMADLNEGEFNFGEPPAVGGASEEFGEVAQAESLHVVLNELENTLENRSHQLEVLEQMLLHQRVYAKAHPAGRPMQSGYVSSGFGWRTDPFTGRKAMHQGIDFAGKAGSPINAVAEGVVTWSADRFGYGNLVEVDHGNGYVTRYAHNERNLVVVGQRVVRGEEIALMGSTGHATGPHLHFEVIKDGRPENPWKYIQRTF